MTDAALLIDSFNENGEALLEDGSVLDLSTIPLSDDTNNMGSTFDKGEPYSLFGDVDVLSRSAFRGYLGVDVSGYNPGINFSVLAASGRHYMVIKVCEGTGYISPSWSSWGYAAAADRVGMLRGGYHFVHTGSAVAQARFLVAIKGKPSAAHMRDWIDIEGSEWNSSNSAPFVAAYIAEYRRLTGVAPGVYCSSSFFNNELHGGAGWHAADVPLWIAHYGVTPGSPGVSGWAIHQYAVGTAPGAGGNIDLNISNGLNMSSVMAYGGKAPEDNKPNGDNTMGACTLADGTPVLAVVGTDGYPYRSLDHGVTFSKIVGDPKIKYLPGVSVTTNGKTGLYLAVRYPNLSLHLVDVPDVNNTAVGVTEWDLKGLGAGTPSVTELPNGDLVVAVKGTAPDRTVYTRERVAGVWQAWQKRKGQAL
jgi:GH25 family lysozyme M1 (1,4-beta-N-acetylmuramidase)